MTNKRFRKLLRAYYTKLNMERPDIHMNMKVMYDITRKAKIQHDVEHDYTHSMYNHVYDVVTLKI